VLNGGPGNDVLKGTGQAGILHGDAGTDTADYSSYQYGTSVSLDGLANDGPPPLASDNIASDVENLTTGEGADFLTGDAGSNVLDGGLGADVLNGGAGVDAVSYASRSTPIYAEVGVAPRSQENEDTIGDDIEGVRGGSGDDTLIGDGGANLLDGGPGDDMLDGRGGPDTLLGGAGQHDLVDYSVRTKPLSVSLDGVANDGESGEGDNAGADIEDIVGGSAGDTLTGNASDNRFDGGAGADTISGRAGEDTVNYSSRNGAVGIYLDGTPTSGNATDGPRGHRDRLVELEDAIGGTVGDVLVGNSSRNVLDGQEGDDVLDGGPGADLLIGREDDDVVDYSRRSTGVTVDLDGSPSSGNAADGRAGARDQVSADIEGIIGTVGSDTLIGSNKDNIFLGGPGADRFSGFGGLDLVVYAERRKPVKVSLDGAANDGQHNERDNVHRDVEGVLGGSAGDVLVGSSKSNVLVGGPGADSLNGLRGVDLLLGGAGADLLTGGRGIDGLEAGPGRDRVQSRDRFVDLVSCGSGRDGVTADAVDSIKRDCEKVDRGRGKKSHAFAREPGPSLATSMVLERMQWWDSLRAGFPRLLTGTQIALQYLALVAEEE
jgi:Ca2+-binding RTX toxin-like protein